LKAEKIARSLDSGKVIVFEKDSSILGIDEELADELRSFIESIINEGEFKGYAIINGESLVFRKREGEILIAFVDGDRIMGSLKKLGEL